MEEYTNEYEPVELMEFDTPTSLIADAGNEQEEGGEPAREEVADKQPEANDRHALPETREVPYQEYAFTLPENYNITDEQQHAANELFSGMEIDQAMAQRLADMYLEMGFERASYHDVPDHYDLKMRDGFYMEGEHLARTEALFKSMGLSNEQAQALCDKYMEEHGKPENYNGIKLRAGFELSPEKMERVNKMFKGMGLSYRQAQEAADFFMDAQAEQQNRIVEDYQRRIEEEIVSVRNDPEIGGQHLKENLSYATSFLDQHGTPELRAAIEEHGMGNNLHLIKFLCRLGKLARGDRLVVGSPSGKGRDAARILYPNMR